METIDLDVQRRLRTATVDTLIQALIQLTHMVHGQDDEQADERREQREHVIRELTRRAA